MAAHNPHGDATIDHIEHIKQGITQIVIEPARTPSISTTAEHDPDDESLGGSGSSNSHGSSPALSPPVWTHRVSASFRALAEQINAASQAIAAIPPTPDSVFTQLSTRMEEIERTQAFLKAEFDLLHEAMGRLTEGPEKFQKQLDEQVATFKLEQQRLPARLANAVVTVQKLPIKPLPMANGKFPPNFPATRGEFEHLTKERYEHLLGSYNLPITGETPDKRDALRIFLGLPQ